MISKLQILATCIQLIVRYTLLSIPLIIFIDTWLALKFKFHIFELFDLTLYDDIAEYNGDGAKPSGNIPSSLIVLVTFFVIPTTFFIGTIYTALKKMWWWLAAYLLTGGTLILKYVILPN